MQFSCKMMDMRPATVKEHQKNGGDLVILSSVVVLFPLQKHCLAWKFICLLFLGFERLSDYFDFRWHIFK